MIVALATAIAFGSCAPVPTEWTVTYTDGVVEHYSTGANRLDLVPRPGRLFSVVQCQEASCSVPQQFVVDPLPGDVDLDGCVGLSDYLELGREFGDCVQ